MRVASKFSAFADVRERGASEIWAVGANPQLSSHGIISSPACTAQQIELVCGALSHSAPRRIKIGQHKHTHTTKTIGGARAFAVN